MYFKALVGCILVDRWIFLTFKVSFKFIARDSMCRVRYMISPVLLSVRASQEWTSQKRFWLYKLNPEILTGSPAPQTRVRGENEQFSSFMRRYVENGKRYDQSYY